MECKALYINTIQIIIKAHKYSFGDTMLNDIRNNKAHLVVISSDAGKSSIKKVIDKCNFYNVKYITLLDKAQMFELFKKEISSFAVIDENLAKKLINNL